MNQVLLDFLRRLLALKSFKDKAENIRAWASSIVFPVGTSKVFQSN